MFRGSLEMASKGGTLRAGTVFLGEQVRGGQEDRWQGSACFFPRDEALRSALTLESYPRVLSGPTAASVLRTILTGHGISSQLELKQ